MRELFSTLVEDVFVVVCCVFKRPYCMWTDRINTSRRIPGTKTKLARKVHSFADTQRKMYLSDRPFFICRKKMRLISIVDYQINSLWINQTHKLVQSVERQKVGNKGRKRPMKKVIGREIEKIR